MSAGERPRLLIVDDEFPLMRALCDTLELIGYATEGFNNAQEALAHLKPGRFQLLLTDLMMPEMDGITLIGAARQIDPFIGAIVMTGHGAIDTAVQAMQMGALDYIVKPFKLNVIRPVLARALDVQRLKQSNAEFEERERRRSEELAVAYRDLEAFAYSISHDLRAPVRAIEGFAQILEEEFNERLGEEGLRLTRIIRDGSRTMDERIVGLLSFSRVGRQSLSYTPLDMTTLAEEAATEALAIHTGPTPQLRITALPTCVGDASVMRQVWCNLIGNALKYSAKRPQPQVQISGRVEDTEAVYRVQDNGAGFDMDHADKLFGVFQRLHDARDFAGTGVGLAIVQRIVSRHGGRIWAQGSPDAGACFQFALPHTQLPGATDAAEPTVEPSGGSA